MRAGFLAFLTLIQQRHIQGGRNSQNPEIGPRDNDRQERGCEKERHRRPSSTRRREKRDSEAEKNYRGFSVRKWQSVLGEF